MDPIILSKLKDSWLKKQHELSKKRRPRRYLHFDQPIPLLKRNELDKITSVGFITRHSFFPLIKVPKSSRLYKKDPISKIKTIEWKERPIGYASHFDSKIYSWYTHQLEYNYEQRLITAGLGDSVIAYRKLNKSNVDFALEIFEFIKVKGECSVLALDIKGFYDNLEHNLLKKAWKNNLGVTDLPPDHYAIYKSITKYAYVRLREIFKILKIGIRDFRKSSLFFKTDTLDFLREKKKIKTNDTQKNKFGNNIGIPQGTPISCALSNLYMFDFDRAISSKILALNGLYRRYSDDIIIVCPRENIKEIEGFAQTKINEVHLEIQKAKTEIRHFSSKDGLKCVNEENRISKLQYLGVEFSGEKVMLRHKSFARFERRMKNAIVSKIIKSKKYKTSLFKRKIYETYSPMGKENYFDYIRSATSKLKKSSFKIITKQTDFNKIMTKINNKIRKETGEF